MAGLWLQPPLPVRLLARQQLPCGQSSHPAEVPLPPNPQSPSPSAASGFAGPNCPWEVGGAIVVMLLPPQRTYGVPTWRRARSWRSMGCPPQMPLA